MIAALTDAFGQTGQRSTKLINASVRDVVFDSLDPAGRRGGAFPDRLAEAMKQLSHRLSAPLSSYMCFVPVAGMTLDSNQRPRIGHVSFVTFGRHSLARIGSHRPAHAKDEGWRWTMQALRKSPTWNSPCAVISVKAGDAEAAQALARREVRSALDLLNFFSDLAPYNHGWAYLIGDAAMGREVTPIMDITTGDFELPHKRVPPLTAFSWAKLHATTPLKRPLQVVSRLAGC